MTLILIRIFYKHKLWNAEAGLYYNSTRWYDPVAGRFISVSPLAPFAEEEYAFCGNDPVNYVDINGLNPSAINEHYEKLEENGVAVNRYLDPETAQNLYDGINTGAQCALELATPMPGDEVYAAGLTIFKFSKYLRRIPIIKKLFKPVLLDNVISYTIRTTRHNNPGIRVKLKNGFIVDITNERIKMWRPYPDAPKGITPVKFKNFLFGSKGKKRVPTPEELDLLDYLTKK